MTIRVAVVGASGKLGSAACAVISASDDLAIHAKLNSQTSLAPLAGADVVFDATTPRVSAEVVATALASGIPIVVGTSGWDAARISGVTRSARENGGAAVLFVPNFSLGSVLGTTFARLAARFFDSIEIIENHHAGKIDSPSGTATRTAELIGAARSAYGLGPVAAPHAEQRARGELISGVPVHSLRMHGVAAEQQVLLGGTGEMLRITHAVTSSAAYDSGILLALRSVQNLHGVTVGLEQLLDLNIP